MTQFKISSILYGNDNTTMLKLAISDLPFLVGVEYFAFELDATQQKLLEVIHDEIRPVFSSFHSPMRKAEPTCLLDSADYNDLIANWRKSLELCVRYGCEDIVYHTNNCFVPKDKRLIYQRNSMANALTLNQLCRSYGVKMLVETLALPSCGAPIFTESEFVDFVKSNDLYALIDVGHMNINGYDYEKVISELNDRILAYHIHNNDGIEDKHDMIDRGTFDYDNFARLYRKFTPKASLVIEYIDIPDLTKDKLCSDIIRLNSMVSSK